MAADPIIGRVTISLRNRMDQLPVLQQTLGRQLEQYARNRVIVRIPRKQRRYT